jgi:beta-N-acetylhexosaminidase
VCIASVNGKVVGFAITYLIRSGSQWNKALAYHKGALASLVVDDQHRNTGIGSALHAQALEYLTTKVKDSFQYASPTPDKSSIQLGSTFPRIFPGIPEGPGFDEAKAWFERRGWKFGDKKSIDLYQSLKSGHRSDLEGMMKKALDGGFTFGEPRVKDLEGVLKKALDGGFISEEPRDGDLEKLYQLQKDNFDSYTVGL